MCDVFFFGTALNIPSHMSDRNPGTLIEIDGNVIDARRGRDGCVVYIDGDLNNTLDNAELVCRCKSAMTLNLNECLVVADTKSMEMLRSCWYVSILKKLSAPKIDAISRARTALIVKGKVLRAVPGCARRTWHRNRGSQAKMSEPEMQPNSKYLGNNTFTYHQHTYRNYRVC